MKYQELKSTSYPKSGAFYTIERAGQESLEKGDRIRAIVTIHIPAIKREGYTEPFITEALQFGDRVNVAGESLHRRWGLPTPDKQFRTRKHEIFAETWKEAFEQGAEWAHENIMRLENAIAAREEALKRAEGV